VNWAINIGILVLIIASYIANREGAYHLERLFTGLLVVTMGITVFYGVMKLRQMQTTYDAHVPPKAAKS
jgi:amino acid transporter